VNPNTIDEEFILLNIFHFNLLLQVISYFKVITLLVKEDLYLTVINSFPRKFKK